MNAFNKSKIKKTAELLISQVEKTLSERNTMIEDIKRGNVNASLENISKTFKVRKKKTLNI